MLENIVLWRLALHHVKNKQLFAPFIGVFVILVSFTLACGTSEGFTDIIEEADTGSAATSQINRTFSGSTEQVIETLEVPPEARVVDLRVKSNLRSGVLSWVLTDPSGIVRWEERLEGATIYSEVRQFNAVTGEWTLQIDLSGATGDLDISWEAKD